MPVSHKLPILLLLLCGCAHGFDRAALRERMNGDAVQSSDAAIAEARGLRPQLRFPCRVAVYLHPDGRGDWRWTPEDKAAMEVWATALKQEGIAADVFPIPEMLAGKGTDLKELRLAAAKCGADALFVIRGGADTFKYMNPLAVFNLTLVGGFVVPGSSRDSLFVVEGVLLDVDNGYVYTGVQAEGVGKIMRPTFVIEEKDAVAKAKTKAVAQFGDEVLKRMRALRAMPQVSDVPRVRSAPADRVGRIIVEGSDGSGQRVIMPLAGTSRATHGLTPDNAGGVMTGITAPRPNP